MDRTPVTSSTVAEVGYDPSSMTMEVLFHSGFVYQYFDIPEVLYQEMIRAESVGKFLNANIKNNYRYTRL